MMGKEKKWTVETDLLEMIKIMIIAKVKILFFFFKLKNSLLVFFWDSYSSNFDSLRSNFLKGFIITLHKINAWIKQKIHKTKTIECDLPKFYFYGYKKEKKKESHHERWRLLVTNEGSVG